MTAAEKKAVPERMTAYWAERRKQAGLGGDRRTRITSNLSKTHKYIN